MSTESWRLYPIPVSFSQSNKENTTDSLRGRSLGCAPPQAISAITTLKSPLLRPVMIATTSSIIHSGTSLAGFSRLTCSSKRQISIRHFRKQLPGTLAIPNSGDIPSPLLLKYPLRSPPLPLKRCASAAAAYSEKSAAAAAYSEKSAAASVSDNLSVLETVKTFSLNQVKDEMLGMTPLDVCKWAGILSVAIAAIKWVLGVVFNPFFWMYFSWSWLFWPWLAAIGVGIYGFYCFRKHSLGKANIFEQLSIVTSTITWLTLVPPGHVNGFLQGWPFFFFAVYHYFFFLHVTVRKRQYGDYIARKHDPKWDVKLPSWCQFLFSTAVMVGHWMAAIEAPELHLIPGGWGINTGIWMLIMAVIFTHYYATVFLAKYTDNSVEPTAVVQFGPYRSVRHPLYASTMLLFVSYFVALRAPLSMLYMIAVCLTYYGQKAKLEEELMMESFGDRYAEYMNKVQFKFIPFVY